AASISEVSLLMSQRKHSCVIVCEQDKAVGLISERDVVRVLAEVLSGKAADMTAGDFMSSPVISIQSDRSVEEAYRLMRSRGIRRLLVADEHNAPAGILTQSDLMRAHLQTVEHYQKTLEARVAERTARLESANEQLEALARVDPLMNIGNRRAMEEALAVAHQRSLRYQRTYSIILLDVDKFKAFNDTYGHPRGDRVLRDIAREVTGCVRNLDTVYRYGGEEVLILLPETDTDGAMMVADRIRSAVAGMETEHRSSEHKVVTISAGIATSVPRKDGSIPGVLDLLGAADQSLYQAKDEGRNRLGRVVKPE
ncbi:MAG: GGDEF domain-containing protein, partial [Gammaproteobacteria bacterium]|nr:GGDEF domain-containing protein [Gammaproteobacteria bacterium]